MLIDGGMECAVYAIRGGIDMCPRWHSGSITRFDDRLGTRESYCILVYIVWLPFSVTAESCCWFTCAVKPRSPRPHDDVTLTDLIMARHIVARES